MILCRGEQSGFIVENQFLHRQILKHISHKVLDTRKTHLRENNEIRLNT